MEMEERDFVVFTDDDGNEFELDVLGYFEYEEQEYAILSDVQEDADAEEDYEVYIMKVVVDGEMEEFLPADEDKMDELVAIAEELLAGEDCDCEGDCGCEEEDCGCGCDCEK
ncbi:MAG: DUF1292 domain-containing protein [Clostridiales bacterium]|nr:DUF1292 domain-containing protein [Clostridiales bacterium]